MVSDHLQPNLDTYASVYLGLKSSSHITGAAAAGDQGERPDGRHQALRQMMKHNKQNENLQLTNISNHGTYT